MKKIHQWHCCHFNMSTKVSLSMIMTFKGLHVLINYLINLITPSHLLILEQFQIVFIHILFEMMDELEVYGMIKYAKFLKTKLMVFIFLYYQGCFSSITCLNHKDSSQHVFYQSKSPKIQFRSCIPSNFFFKSRFKC